MVSAPMSGDTKSSGHNGPKFGGLVIPSSVVLVILKVVPKVLPLLVALPVRATTILCFWPTQTAPSPPAVASVSKFTVLARKTTNFL